VKMMKKAKDKARPTEEPPPPPHPTSVSCLPLLTHPCYHRVPPPLKKERKKEQRKKISLLWRREEGRRCGAPSVYILVVHSVQWVYHKSDPARLWWGVAPFSDKGGAGRRSREPSNRGPRLPLPDAAGHGFLQGGARAPEPHDVLWQPHPAEGGSDEQEGGDALGFPPRGRLSEGRADGRGVRPGNV